jgi:hypothetical protein
MSLAHKKLLREYGDPHNNMAAKEFRRDLARLLREVREEQKEKDAKAGYNEAFECLKRGTDANTSQAVAQCVAAAIRGQK